MAEEKVIDEKMYMAIENLCTSVTLLRMLYDKDPTLNDRFDISSIVPRSLDEWENELLSWVDEQKACEIVEKDHV